MGWKLLGLALEALSIAGLAVLELIASAIVAASDFRLLVKAVLLLGILLGSVAMVRAAFIQARLCITYWHYERGTCLQLDQDARTATYTNAGGTVQFALAEVVGITQCACYRRHSASRYVIGRDYYY